MPYTPNQWVDDDKTRPLSAERLAHAETQYAQAMADVAAQVSDSESAIGAPLYASIAEQTDGRLGPASSWMPLPDLLDSSWTYNTAPYAQDNPCTLGDGTQYAVWIRTSDKHQIIGKRNVETGTAWETFDLTTIAGAPFDTQAADGHNTFSIGVDSDGNVHVAGNMHDNAMRYARTTTPGDITTLTAASMVGTDETSVTYPCFFNTTDGTFWVLYRQGGTGGIFVNRWDGAAWVRVGQPISNTVATPYPHHVAVDPTRPQSFGLFWTWRTIGSDAASNTDISWIETVDGGATWIRTGGSTVTTPVTYPGTTEIIVDIPVNSGLINQSGADVDANGDPHSVWVYEDATTATSQYMHVYRQGGIWLQETVTTFDVLTPTEGVSTLDLRTARPALYCYDGKVFIVGRATGARYAGNILLIDATPGADHTPTVLFADNLHEWDPATDLRGLRERGEINLLVVDVQSPAPAGTFTAEPAGILTVNLAKAAAVQVTGTAFGAVSMSAIVPEDAGGAESTPILLPPTAFYAVNGTPAITVSTRAALWQFDAAAIEGIATVVQIPTGWETVNIDLLWIPATGTGDVVWRCDVAAVSTSGTFNPDPPTGTSSTASTNGASLVSTRMQSGVALTGPIMLELMRLATDVADTLTTDARLLAVTITRAS